MPRRYHGVKEPLFSDYPGMSREQEFGTPRRIAMRVFRAKENEGHGIGYGIERAFHVMLYYLVSSGPRH